MLVFSSAKLVLLSVPKTGSTAYQEALLSHASIAVTSPPELKHAPVFRYNRFFRPALEKFVGENLTVVAVMREPLDWLGSWYRYRLRPSAIGQPTATQGLSFDEFVQAYIKGNQPEFARVGSQAKFLESQPNGTAVTHLFRYEDQTGLKTFLEQRLKLSFQTARVNTSPSAPLEISEKTMERFRRKCAKEFELWSSIGEGGEYTPLATDT